MAENPEPWRVLILTIFGLNFWQVDKLRARALLAVAWPTAGAASVIFVVRGLSITGRLERW